MLVILGNPPYNGFAGMAVDEERELSEAYRTVREVRKPDCSRTHGLPVPGPVSPRSPSTGAEPGEVQLQAAGDLRQVLRRELLAPGGQLKQFVVVLPEPFLVPGALGRLRCAEGFWSQEGVVPVLEPDRSRPD